MPADSEDIKRQLAEAANEHAKVQQELLDKSRELDRKLKELKELQGRYNQLANQHAVASKEQYLLYVSISDAKLQTLAETAKKSQELIVPCLTHL